MDAGGPLCLWRRRRSCYHASRALHLHHANPGPNQPPFVFALFCAGGGGGGGGGY